MVSPLITDFETILDLCCEQEHLEPLPPKLKRRIAAAYERAIEKALVMAWYELADPSRANRTLFRHAERGAREYVP